MRDNSMLVDSNEKRANLQSYHFNYVIVSNQEAFERLGFKFKFNNDKNDEFDVTLPEGWSIEDSMDVFTLDFVDENHVDYGKIEFGNYPYRKGYMWLYTFILIIIMFCSSYYCFWICISNL